MIQIKNNNDLYIQGTTKVIKNKSFELGNDIFEYQLATDFKNVPKEKHELFLQIFSKL